MSNKYSTTYTEKEIRFILDTRNDGYTWDEVTDLFNKEFSSKKSSNAIRKTYARFEDFEFSEEEMLSNMRKAFTASKGKAVVTKENKVLINYIESRESLLNEIQDLFTKTKFTKPKSIKIKKDKKKRNMTVETMLSDLHFGKLTKTFNSNVARERMSKLAEVTVKDIQRKNIHYNIDSVNVLLIGDIIENATMHGVESRRSSEFGDAEQVRLAVDSIYHDYIVPVASLGIPLKFYCVPGNHDRMSKEKTYQDPGFESFTWIIYKMLEMLCKKAKIKANFEISKGVYLIYDVYGSKVLVEHGDHIKGGVSEKSCKNHLANRSSQYGSLIRFFRLGHYHKECTFNRGEIVCNSSLPGSDSYSEINGYNSSASQYINYYVKSKNRPDPFYHSFSIFLE